MCEGAIVFGFNDFIADTLRGMGLAELQKASVAHRRRLMAMELIAEQFQIYKVHIDICSKIFFVNLLYIAYSLKPAYPNSLSSPKSSLYGFFTISQNSYMFSFWLVSYLL